jgi:hypothetical protein
VQKRICHFLNHDAIDLGFYTAFKGDKTNMGFYISGANILISIQIFACLYEQASDLVTLMQCTVAFWLCICRQVKSINQSSIIECFTLGVQFSTPD